MKLTSKAMPSSEGFKNNRAAHLDALAVISEAAEAARMGGGEKSRARHESRGKMLPRRRVANLLDPGSPFLEIGATAAHDMYGNAAPAAGVVAGIGRVHGQEVMVVCNDATVKGGTYFPMTVKNTCARRRLPRKTTCRASTWWTPAAQTCRNRTRCFRTATTLAGSFTTRRGCPRKVSRRSRWSWGRVRRAALTSRRCRT